MLSTSGHDAAAHVDLLPVVRTGPLPRFGLWTLTYAVAALVGRATVLEPGGLSLVWPAAGVAFLWLLTQPTPSWRRACLVVMAVVLAAVLVATGASTEQVVVLVVANVVQTVVAVVLLARWCGGAVLGVGGDASVHDLGLLVRGSLAVAIATLLGAAIGSGGLALLGADLRAASLVDWWGRNLTGVFLLGVVGHLVWEALSERARGRTTWRESVLGTLGVGELVVLLVASVGLYVLAFGQPDMPLAFAVVPLGVWCASRFPTLTAVAHTSFFGAALIRLTLAGRGPFGSLDTPETEVLMTQGFLMVLLLTVLAVATGRDERTRLIDELRTTQTTLAERAELLDAMTEAMTEGVVVTDDAGRIVRTNSAARDLLGSDPEGVADPASAYAVRRMDGSPLARDDLPSRRALREGVVAPHDLQVESAAGVPRVLSVTAAALTGGVSPAPRAGAVVVYRDVTEDRRRSTRLADFAAVVAHDLRTPLHVTHGWIQLAAANRSGDDGPGAKALARANASCELMESLIDDLLAQAVAEDGAIHVVPLVLDGPDGLVARLATELLAPGEQGQVVVEGTLPEVLADPDMVRQLLLNLVTNALKYVAPGTVPRVVLTGRRDGERVRVDVTDNGVGIPEGEHEHVFERFHRAHTRTPGLEGVGGTGLGLTICRTIAERHGGTLWCEPAGGTASGGAAGGTVFHLDLPAAAPRSG
ncbi:ATP-binding protein [Nocardioides rubriscoriae]|uniref:ATP-binding protein n=1 Tax=Nocardioides rubriscoriae TaxID=642762 RepID=UPI0011DFAD31|nr:ATP-binding protein [Nocardioides rubriscoriae]